MKAARHFERTGDIEPPEYFASRLPKGWEDQVYLTLELLQFQRDGIEEPDPPPGQPPRGMKDLLDR